MPTSTSWRDAIRRGGVKITPSGHRASSRLQARASDRSAHGTDSSSRACPPGASRGHSGRREVTTLPGPQLARRAQFALLPRGAPVSQPPDPAPQDPAPQDIPFGARRATENEVAYARDLRQPGVLGTAPPVPPAGAPAGARLPRLVLPLRPARDVRARLHGARGRGPRQRRPRCSGCSSSSARSGSPGTTPAARTATSTRSSAELRARYDGARSPAPRRSRPHELPRADDRPVRDRRPDHALHHAGREPAEQDRRRLLRGRALVHRVPERSRDLRRLHVGGELPRHLRRDRAVGLRRVPVLDRLPRRLAGRAAAGRGVHAQLRALHDGRRPVVPHAATPCPDGGGDVHDRGLDLLPARPDGRRGQARQPADRRGERPGEEPDDRDRRRADDRLRDRRRHARHDLGADRQGRPAHGRDDHRRHARADRVQVQRLHHARRGGEGQRQGGRRSSSARA